jgi:hypothetical protein
MKLENKKMAVLHQLCQEAEPIGLLELIKKLEGNYVERTVRRWLLEMVNDGLVEKVGNKRNTKYQVKKRSDRDDAAVQSCFREESLMVLEKVRKPLYLREPISYQSEWLESYQPNTTFYIPDHLLAQLQKAGKRSEKEDPAGTYAHQIYNRLLIDLSYNSSRLEGNTYSLLDTQKLLLEGAGNETKLEEEKIMILNHKEAIRYLVDNAQRIQVTEQTICTLHYLLADGLVEAKHAGKARDHGVRIGGSTYIPFENKKQIEQLMKAIVEKAFQIKNPYEQSLFLLAHISYLQAFSDVNKRTARLCANIPLIKGNYVPLSFNDVIREDYASALIAVYELQDIRPLLDVYLFSYMRTCAMYDATIRAVGFDEIRVRYRQERRGVIRQIVLNQLTGRALNDFITEQTRSLIPLPAQDSFVEDVIEDLEQIDESRIAGLGITSDDLARWKRISGRI